MAFLIETFWVPLVLAALVGIVIGWATCSNRQPAAWLSSWLPFGMLAAIIGVYAAAEYVVPGRYGLWLETGLMMFAAYLAGCCISCFIHSMMFGPPRAAERDPNAALVAKKSAGIDSIAAERRERERLAALSDGKAGTAASTASTSTFATVTGLATAGKATAFAATSVAGKKVVDLADVGARDAAARAGALGIGRQPALLSAPRNGNKDDLTLIWGVAEKLEQRMNKMGIWHFDQIAAWTPEHVKWFEHEMEGFKDRLDRDKWIEQCEKLAKGWRPDNKAGTRPKG